MIQDGNLSKFKSEVQSSQVSTCMPFLVAVLLKQKSFAWFSNEYNERDIWISSSAF